MVVEMCCLKLKIDIHWFNFRQVRFKNNNNNEHKKVIYPLFHINDGDVRSYFMVNEMFTEFNLIQSNLCLTTKDIKISYQWYPKMKINLCT